MADGFCKKCGAPLPKDSGFCTECGTPISPETPNAASQQVPGTSVPYYSEPAPAYASPVYDAPPPQSSRYAVLGIGGFIGNMLLFAIPVVGWIICIVWACGGCRNENRKNHARAALILGLIGIALAIILGIVLGAMFSDLWTEFLYSAYYW